MKKSLLVAVSILSTALVVSCKGKKEEEKVSKEFKPALDTAFECEIKVIGDYGNFEALEAEFERFNVHYPNVSLTYEKLDDYDNTLATALDRSDKPNIFFTKAKMPGDEKFNAVFERADILSDPALNLDLDCLRPGLVNHDAQGNVKMIPVFSRTYGTLVNDDIFKKENIAVPSTWNELLQASQAFKEKGYKSPMMGYTKGDSSCFMNTVAYPMAVEALSKDATALEKANAKASKPGEIEDTTAGEFMRGSLEKVKALFDNGAVDIEECNKIEDNYSKVLLRFFEGDVPMMVCGGDTPSGTKKREGESEAFKEHPFSYSFVPLPMTDKGGYFIDSPSVEFSINKNCNNLDYTREFMRFLVRTGELNNMASIKRLVSPTKEVSMNSIYAPFGNVPQERTFSPEMIGIKDALATQVRKASYKVGKGDLTIDQAIEQYGTLK